MTATATAYEPFVLPAPALETYIERIPSRDLSGRLDEWKQMRRDGWDVTVLVAPDSRTVLALACRGGQQRFELGTVA
jgi:hypothetical protein